MQGCQAMRLKDVPLPKSKDDFYTILFKTLLSSLPNFIFLGVFRFFNYSHNQKNLQNKMTPQLFVYYSEVTVVIPMTTNKI